MSVLTTENKAASVPLLWPYPTETHANTFNYICVFTVTISQNYTDSNDVHAWLYALVG